jgi:beta-galactosidase
VYLQFDGAQTESTVFLDGHLLGHHASGYTPFDFELAAPHRAALAAKALAATGKDGAASAVSAASAASVLAVRVDATKPDGWWYDGGGLYRHVRLVVVPVVHIALHGGVYAPSAVTGPIDATRLTADVELYPNVTVTAPPSGRSSDEGISVAATCVLHDASGKKVGSSTGQGVALPGANTSIALPTIAVKDALLWTIDRPSLYTVSCTIGTDTVSNTPTPDFSCAVSAAGP